MPFRTPVSIYQAGYEKLVQGGDITEMENSYYGFLLRFITVYSGYYGTFLKDLIDSEPRHQKSLETLIFEKNLEKSSRFITDIKEYYRYYGNRQQPAEGL